MKLEACSSTHNMTALSTFSAVTSAVLMIGTIPLNALIIYCISRRKEKRMLFFYKLLLNIAVADLIKGLLSDTVSVAWHAHEALGIGHTWKSGVPLVHLTLFIPDGVALVSMTILSVDRIFALLAPYQSFRGYFKARTENFIVFCTYPISVLITTPYFIHNYIKQLVIFFACTHSIAVTSLVTLTLIYRHKYKKPISSTNSFNENATGSISLSTTSLNAASSCSSFSCDNVIQTETDHQRRRGVSLEGELPKNEKAKRKLKRHNSAPTIEKRLSNLSIYSICEESREIGINESSQLKVPIRLENLDGNGYIKAPIREGGIDRNLTKKVPVIVKNSNLSDADPQEIKTIEYSKCSYSYNNKTNGHHSNSQHNKQSKNNTDSNKSTRKRSVSLTDIDIFAYISRNRSSSTNTRFSRRTRAEKRVTRTFLLMLIVFIVTYLPTCLVVIILNVEGEHCKLTHVFRDVSVLGILSSSLFRALNFIMTLKNLKREVFRLICTFKSCFKR